MYVVNEYRLVKYLCFEYINFNTDPTNDPTYPTSQQKEVIHMRRTNNMKFPLPCHPFFTTGIRYVYFPSV